ncbi:MAG TPA: hypothetical protein ENK72_00220 [Epsilonproteobacteria bacterium]|nr:hypothetical protein [Campylobacterota bacterium]
MQHLKKTGTCLTCGRLTHLTKHHLVPKKRQKYTKIHDTQKATDCVIEICRVCHNGIHDLYDKRTLAEQFNAPKKLREDEILQKDLRWVSKLKRNVV